MMKSFCWSLCNVEWALNSDILVQIVMSLPNSTGHRTDSKYKYNRPHCVNDTDPSWHQSYGKLSIAQALWA